MSMAELVAGVRDAATNGDKHDSPKSKPVITMTLNEQLALHKQQHGALQVNLCLKWLPVCQLAHLWPHCSEPSLIEQERLRHLNNSLKNFDQRAARAKIE